MNVITNLDSAREDALEHFRAKVDRESWTLVVEGNWSESPAHSGFYTYSVGRTGEGQWVLNQCDRHGFLDDVTEEDVESGALNDDQLQAIWNRSLEEAQAERWDVICAVWMDPPSGLPAEEAGWRLYEAFVDRGGMAVEE